MTNIIEIDFVKSHEERVAMENLNKICKSDIEDSYLPPHSYSTDLASIIQLHTYNTFMAGSAVMRIWALWLSGR